MDEADTKIALVTLAEKDKKYVKALRQLLEVEEINPHGEWIGDMSPTGKAWEQIHTPVAPTTITYLTRAGVLSKFYSTRSTKAYHIVNPHIVQQFIDLYDSNDADLTAEKIERVPYEPPDIPDELFASIEGYEDIKELLHWSIQAEKASHVALKGPPACAKSVFLEDIDYHLPRALYAEGYDSSKAAIRNQLLEERPFFYLIDEFGSMSSKNMAILRGVCGTGRVTVTIANRKETVYLPTRVYVACNRWPRDPDGAIGSRFDILTLDKYKPGEFEQIATATLVKREGAKEELAEYIVEKMAGRTNDVRSIVRVFRVCSGAKDPFARVNRYMEIKLARGGDF